jgi:hypothetical protein
MLDKIQEESLLSGRRTSHYIEGIKAFFDCILKLHLSDCFNAGVPGVCERLCDSFFDPQLDFDTVFDYLSDAKPPTQVPQVFYHSHATHYLYSICPRLLFRVGASSFTDKRARDETYCMYVCVWVGEGGGTELGG